MRIAVPAIEPMFTYNDMNAPPVAGRGMIADCVNMRLRQGKRQGGGIAPLLALSLVGEALGGRVEAAVYPRVGACGEAPSPRSSPRLSIHVAPVLLSPEKPPKFPGAA